MHQSRRQSDLERVIELVQSPRPLEEKQEVLFKVRNRLTSAPSCVAALSGKGCTIHGVLQASMHGCLLLCHATMWQPNRHLHCKGVCS